MTKGFFDKKEKNDTTLTTDEVENVNKDVSKPVEPITDDDRDEVIRKEWKPHYEEQLKLLIAHVKKHVPGDIDRKVMKKLKATAKLCAKNRAITDKKHGK